MAAAAIFIVLTLNTKIIINYVDIKYKKVILVVMNLLII